MDDTEIIITQDGRAIIKTEAYSWVDFLIEPVNSYLPYRTMFQSEDEE